MSSPFSVFSTDAKVVQLIHFSASLSVRPCRLPSLCSELELTGINYRGRGPSSVGVQGLEFIYSCVHSPKWDQIYTVRSSIIVQPFIFGNQILPFIRFLYQSKSHISERTDSFDINLLFPLGWNSKNNNYNKIGVTSIYFGSHDVPWWHFP